ncbi:Replicative DNA helicase [Phycisphaerae bacterium RAS1]|nr:Replicative DNA helicase [Phycisphaerae bacterium RAS1]
MTAARIDRAKLDAIRADRAALVKVLTDARATVNGTASLKCPFHADAHASGGIHEHRGRWYFTCQACTWNGDKRTGDVFDVIRRSRGIGFRDALAELGIHAPPESPGSAAPRRANGRAPTRDTPETRQAALIASRNTAHRGATRRDDDAVRGNGRGVADDPAALAASCATRLQGDPAALDRLFTTRGIDRATAERFGVGVTVDARHWTFGVTDPAGRVVAVKAHRADPDGDGPKSYWTPRGVNSRQLFPVALGAAGPVWLCPGELKALAVAACGRAAIGITAGESADLPDGLGELVHGRPVAIVADDDDAGRRWAAKSLETLTAAGIDARIVDCGLSKAAGLKDVGDLIVERIGDGKEPAEIAAELDAAYERGDPWRPFTLGAILHDPATWTPVEHVRTGFSELDDALGGGLRVGGVTLFVGKTGRAKTQTAVQVALNAARAGVPVGVVSLEMSRRELAHLIAANVADVYRSIFTHGRAYGEPGARFQSALPELERLPLTLCDDDRWGEPLTRSRLADVVADGVKRFGWKILILDYIGLLAAEADDAGEYTADCANSAALRRIARTHNLALLAVADLRKAANFKKGDDDKAPVSLDDVRGAGRIVYDAQNVFAVDSEQADNGRGCEPTGIVKLRALKTRFSGAASRGNVVQLRWHPATGRIIDLERGEPGAESESDN